MFRIPMTKTVNWTVPVRGEMTEDPGCCCAPQLILSFLSEKVPKRPLGDEEQAAAARVAGSADAKVGNQAHNFLVLLYSTSISLIGSDDLGQGRLLRWWEKPRQAVRPKLQKRAFADLQQQGWQCQAVLEAAMSPVQAHRNFEHRARQSAALEDKLAAGHKAASKHVHRDRDAPAASSSAHQHQHHQHRHSEHHHTDLDRSRSATLQSF